MARTTADKTVKNWKWWAIIVPIATLTIPFLVLDLSAALTIYVADEVSDYTYRFRRAFRGWWARWTGPIRRYVYGYRIASHDEERPQ